MIKILSIWKKIQDSKTAQTYTCCFLAMVSALIIMILFQTDFRIEKAETIIALVVIFAVSILLLVYINAKYEFFKFAFICVLLLGGLSVVIQPILNIPDENVHLARAEIISRGDLFPSREDQEFEVIKSVKDMQQEVGKPIIYSDLKNKKIDYSIEKVNHIAASNISLLYIPQAFGILVAKILNLDVIWMLWFGRFFNLIIYAALVSMAIKIAPHLKMLLFFISMLPMCIQQAASLSPDALINGVAILFVGYFLKIFTKESINKIDLFLFWLIAICITLSKVTNICMAGLILLIPLKKKYGIKKAIIIKVAFVGSIILIGAIYYFYTTTFAYNLGFDVYYRENNVNSSEQIQYILDNFIHWLRNFGASSINRSEEYISMLNNFGWLSYGYPLLTCVTVFMVGKICAQENGIELGKFSKFLVVLMGIGTYLFTCLALYISWTPVGSSDIYGVQGRYLIPAILLFGLVCSTSRSERENNSLIPENTVKYGCDDFLIKNVVNVTVIFISIGIMLILTAVHFY